MKLVSETGLAVVLVLIMTLSAGATFCLAWLPNPTGAPLSSRLSEAQASPTIDARVERKAPLTLAGSHVDWRTNPWAVLVSGLNLLLTLLVVILLRRRARYRHTLFAKAFRSSPLSITISTLSEGRYVDVNHAFLQMLGYERRDIIGRTTAELGIWADPDDRVKMLQQMGASVPGRGIHTRLKARSGDVREASVTAEVIDHDGVPCVLAVTQDVTESKRMENQLRQAQRMGSIGRLAGGVAHDFNNILTVIMGYSELASYRLGGDHVASKHLGEIKRAAERATSLTRQLLAFSRQQMLYPRILDLNAVVNNLTQMLLRMIGEDITLTFKPGATGNIKADPGQIEQILMNLVVNARDAMPQGGVIAIETSCVSLDEGYIDSHFSMRPGHYVMMTVSDTGCGMDEKTMSQIFEPFFTTKVPGQGTGLGLSTVYGIVKQSEGYIWVYSEPQRGTSFKLYFPEHTRDTQVATGESLPRLEPASGSETVLLVEDDEALRKLTSVVLESSGYKVLEAANGEAAINVVASHGGHIDLLLSDVLMPFLSGVELSARLRKVQPNLKVLLMTGYAGDLLARYHDSESDIMLIEKPFTRHALLSKVRAALQS